MLKSVEAFGANVAKTDGQEALTTTKMIETHVAKQKTNFKTDMIKLNQESAVYSKTLTQEKELEEKNRFLKKEIDDHLSSVRDMVKDVNGQLPGYVKNVHGWMQDNQKQLEPNHNKRFLRRTKRLVGVMRAKIAAVDGTIGAGAPGATSTGKTKAKTTGKKKLAQFGLNLFIKTGKAQRVAVV